VLEQAGIFRTPCRESVSVLIVEDEDITRRALDNWLTARRFRVQTAVDCASALRSAVSHQPDVILLDVSLFGGDDGLRLPRSLKDIGLNVPFVVFTGTSGPSAAFEAYKLAAFAVIEKPALPDHIAEDLRRAAVSDGLAAAHATPIQAPDVSEHVRKAVTFIERHFATKHLSASKIASEVNLSRDNLGRKFRGELGCSMLTYLHRTRHTHAKRLLTGSEMSVKEIADCCGYRDAGELARTFLRLVGASPTEFRAAHQRAPTASAR
jgi:YesN/AraC family two-component response regulator